MAPPRKPTTFKVIAGTIRKDRDGPGAENAENLAVGMELVDLAHPPPPSWLPNVYAVEEWHRLAPILVANRLLTTGALSALGMLCALHGKVVQLYAAGEAPTTSMVATWRSLINDFGLTPAAQEKVKAVGHRATPPENPFAQNGRRPSSIV